jgi:hypothetical protein
LRIYTSMYWRALLTSDRVELKAKYALLK